MNKIDGIALIIFTPMALTIAFSIGTFIRAIFIKDEYKINVASMTINCIIGIVAIAIIHFVTK